MDNSKFNLKALSTKVRGLNSQKKRCSIFNWLRQKNANIVFLQETYSTQAVENIWRNEWGGDIIMAHGTNHSKGVAILVKNNFDMEVKRTYTSENGRIIIIKVLIQDAIFYLIYIHASTTENSQVQFFQDLIHQIDNFGIEPTDKLLICGDFNVVMDPFIDKKGGSTLTKEKSVEKINELMSLYDLHDTWRLKNPNLGRFTWRGGKPLIQCRLDFWLIPDELC